ncbi:MAG: type II toxin-antitoxin system ChpB family toxin [Methylophilaceae bacterium]|nr:type II toxin-antitoxin system ChpB family toxin [Methylophilaceae bacterium]
MVKPLIFNRGDVVYVDLNPVIGRELQGEGRPALVLSTKEFNALGTAMVAPITQGGNAARFAGFAVSLSGTGLQTQGVVLVNAIRALDLVNRKAIKKEIAPDFIVQDCLARIQAIFE